MLLLPVKNVRSLLAAVGLMSRPYCLSSCYWFVTVFCALRSSLFSDKLRFLGACPSVSLVWLPREADEGACAGPPRAGWSCGAGRAEQHLEEAEERLW